MIANRDLQPQSFRDVEFKNYHWFLIGAPGPWSEERGATHTLLCDDGTTRPLRLLKTRCYVGVDELPGGEIKWERWMVVPDRYLQR